MRKLAFLALAGAALLARCATTIPAAPESLSEPARNLADPRTGYPQAVPARDAEGLGQAWDLFRGARIDEAARKYDALARRDGNDRVARLGLAAVAIAQGRFDEASSIVDRASEGFEGWAAAANYRGEIALARGDLSAAWKAYEPIYEAFPRFHQRGEDIRTRLLASLVEQAKSSDPQTEASLMREVLALNPASTEARLGLVQALGRLGRWDEARTEIQPLISGGKADLNEVQAALAEIEVGHGNLQSAIRRYERLVQRTGDEIYAKRLGEVRQLWQDANLPPHYQRAVASHAITRAQLAIIAFWRVDAVRFAQNVGPPPIAVDIADVAGRDEFVRCLALKILPVDPTTREANPSRTVTVAAFVQIADRLLDLSGTPACAAGTNSQLPASALSACGVDLSVLPSSPDAFVDGHVAAMILDQVARAVR